jgi:hypothetical protein
MASRLSLYLKRLKTGRRLAPPGHARRRLSEAPFFNTRRSTP